MNKDFELNDIPDEQLPKASPIPLKLFSRRTNKTTQLVNNKDQDFSVDGRHRWFEFELETPVFVQEISVETDGYYSWDSLHFEIVDVSGEKTAQDTKSEEGIFSINVGRTCQSLRFKPNAKFSILSSQSIKQVTVIGYTPEQLKALEKAIGSMDERESQIDKKYSELEARKAQSEEAINGLKEEIVELEKSKNHLDTEVGQSQAQLDALKKENSASRTTNSELENKQKDLEATVESKRKEQRELNSILSEKNSELNRITQEIRLFPSEISGFVSEGRRSIRNYLMIGAPFVCVILYGAYYLFSNAVELAKFYQDGDVDVWSIFVSRLPFVAVAITILQVCGFAVSRLIYEIVQINRQRLNLSKISIIAKDVSTASTADLDLTSEQKFEMETHLKMELLREHMKHYVGESFVYQSGRIESFLPEWKSRKKKKQEPAQQNTEEVIDVEREAEAAE